MDTASRQPHSFFHHPLPPTPPAAVVQAREVISHFQDTVELHYEEARSVAETAVQLYQEMHQHCHFGHSQVKAGHKTQADMERTTHELAEKQKASWNKILAESQRLLDILNASYKTVQQAEEDVKRACGFHVEGLSTQPAAKEEESTVGKEEKSIMRRYYHHQLHRAFRDAHQVMTTEMAGYPDGLLTKAETLHKRAAKDQAMAVEGKVHGDHLVPTVNYRHAKFMDSPHLFPLC